MKKCLLCDAEPVSDDVATCQNDGEATWAPVEDAPADETALDVSPDAPKRGRGRPKGS
jgi:hypothetical protein